MNFKTVSFKIHKIQIITFIAAKLNKLFVANKTLNFWTKKFCDVNSSRFVNPSTVQHDFEQPYKVHESLQLHCFLQCQNQRVLNCPLFPFNGCLSVIDCDCYANSKICSTR